MIEGAAVGVDVGGTKIAASLVSRDGELLSDVITTPTPCHEGRTAMMDAIAGIAQQVADRSGNIPIHGVGVGTAGVVSDTGVVISSTDALSEWASTNIPAELHRRLPWLKDKAVYVDNDVNAYALGEAWQGSAAQVNNAVVIAVGTGIGGALIIDGRLLRGARFVAGEIGHIPAPGAEGEPCTCGRTGHLEAVSAGPQILRRYREKGGKANVADTRQLAARLGSDELARDVFYESAVALGKVAAGLVATVNPEMVVISGGIAAVDEYWWKPLEATYAAELISPIKDIPMQLATLGTNAPIVGAAYGTFFHPIP